MLPQIAKVQQCHGVPSQCRAAPVAGKYGVLFSHRCLQRHEYFVSAGD